MKKVFPFNKLINWLESLLSREEKGIRYFQPFLFFVLIAPALLVAILGYCFAPPALTEGFAAVVWYALLLLNMTFALLIVRILSLRKKTEDRIRSILQTTTDGFWMVDTQGQIVDVNEAYCWMTGYSREELLMMKISRIEIAQAEGSISQRISKIIELGYDRFLTKYMKKDGTIVDVEVTANFLSTEGAFLVAFVRDITDRKKAEEKLKQAMDLKSEFTAIVSHELRTPLGPIKEGVSIILDGLAGDINAEQRDLLETVRRNAERLRRFINNVLDLQKLGSGRMEFDFEENDINNVAQEAYRIMEFSAKQKGLHLVREFDSPIPLLKFDKDKIEQVLLNLLSNAIKFTEKGYIKIKTSVREEMVYVSIADTGPGIKEDDIPKLFQTFQRIESRSTKRVEGTGLGLAICKEVILGHGGRIWVESEFGQGSAFHFVLPLKGGVVKYAGEDLNR